MNIIEKITSRRMNKGTKKVWQDPQLWKNVAIITSVIILGIFVNKYQDKNSVILCYQEQINSYIYPEKFGVQQDFKDFCSDKGILLEELGRDYEDLPNNLPNEYEMYMSILGVVCPFVSTAVTSDCLDNEIIKQQQQYTTLANEIFTKAQINSEDAKRQNQPVGLEISGILNSLPTYTKTKNSYIEQVCSIKNFSITGTAIVEESRKCKMYYNYKDIQMLQDVLSSI